MTNRAGLRRRHKRHKFRTLNNKLCWQFLSMLVANRFAFAEPAGSILEAAQRVRAGL